MYAAGTSIRPLRSTHSGGRLRHLGRWLLVAALIVLASLTLARVALGGTAVTVSGSDIIPEPEPPSIVVILNWKGKP